MVWGQRGPTTLAGPPENAMQSSLCPCRTARYFDEVDWCAHSVCSKRLFSHRTSTPILLSTQYFQNFLLFDTVVGHRFAQDSHFHRLSKQGSVPSLTRSISSRSLVEHHTIFLILPPVHSQIHGMSSAGCSSSFSSTTTSFPPPPSTLPPPRHPSTTTSSYLPPRLTAVFAATITAPTLEERPRMPVSTAIVARTTPTSSTYPLRGSPFTQCYLLLDSSTVDLPG